MRATTGLITIMLLASVAQLAAQEEPGYPIEEFLAITSFTEVAVAPNGETVAFIARKNNLEDNRRESAIWKFDIDRGNATAPKRLTFAPGSYSELLWSPDSRYLAFLSNRDDEETQQLFLLDIQGGEARRLTDAEQFGEGLVGYDWMPRDSDLIFAAPVPLSEAELEARKEFYGDVERHAAEQYRTSFWRVATADLANPIESIATVEMTVQGLKVSPNGETIAFLSGAPTRPQTFFNTVVDYEIHLLSVDGGEEPRQVTDNVVAETNFGWRRDGDALYALGRGYSTGTRGRWTQARLFQIELDGQIDAVVAGFEGELGSPYGNGAFVELRNGSLLTNGTVSTRRNIFRVAPGEASAERLTDFRGSVSNVSASSDGTLIAFALVTYNTFPEIFVAGGVDDLANARRVTNLNADIAQLAMPEIEAVRWSNGEGDEIEGVLYWPPGQRGQSNLPFIVDIHGGPWSVRTENLGPFSFGYYPALLASRGYLVLEPNYRGGVGRGDDFLHALEGYSCSRPATDILTGVDYLVERGWADADRMGVMGYSYGGLLTNCLITRTDRFRAAASGAGLWNDISYFGTADNFTQNDVRNLGAAPWENFKNYWEESPISGAGNIRTPTIITIGGADRRVPTTQGLELYRALVRLGVPAELLVFPGEPHGFTQPAHMLIKMRAEIAWMDRYLLGKEVAVFE